MYNLAALLIQPRQGNYFEVQNMNEVQIAQQLLLLSENANNLV